MAARIATFVLCAVLVASSAAAEGPQLVVIVNAAQNVDSLDKKWVADAFLKKRLRWSADLAIQPVDQGKQSPARTAFSRWILDRSLQSVRTYWNQIIFSGRGVPPPEVESDAAVVSFVSSHAGAIGYVSAGTQLRGVKVVEVR